MLVRSMRQRWSFALAALSLALFACFCASAASARIVSQLSWRHPLLVDPPGQLTRIACSSAMLCVAADESGNVVTSTDPAGGAAAWNLAHVDNNQGCDPGACSFQAISCPSTSFCAALDNGAGYVFTSTDPTAGAAGWSGVRISAPNTLAALSCPSITLCVAVDYHGSAITSTSPTAGAGTWHTATIDSGPCTAGVCHSIGKGPPERQLDTISCPSVSLCVAGDWDGDVVTSTNPTGGSSAWSAAYVDPNLEGAHDGGVQVSIAGVSCPSLLWCVASDGTGGVVTSQDPAGGASAWKLARAAPGTGGLGGGGFGSLSCSSASFCAALYTAAWNAPTEVDLTYNPLNGAEWTPVPSHQVTELSAISCPSELLCVGVHDGNVIVGRAKPPTRTQIQALLRSDMTPHGSSAPIGKLLRNRGFSLSLNPPTPGSIRIRWLFRPTAGSCPGGRVRPVLIARGQSDLAETESATIPLTLTNAGATILRHHDHLRVTAEAIFSPLDRQTFTTTRTFVLRR